MQTIGAITIPTGTTKQVSLGRTASGIFVLSMNAIPNVNPENRWTLPFTLAIHKAFDAIEEALANDPPNTPAALLTISESPKFFSNGIDPTYAGNPKSIGLKQWHDVTMPAFARPILLPIPTICAINGHAFGAGMMFALGHDYRLQRKERGYLCAIEIVIGIAIPPAELTLFRHDMPVNAFHQTTLTGKRWKAIEAERAGVVHEAVAGDQLLSVAMKKSEELAKLSTNRKIMKHFKRQLKGYVAEEILHGTFPNGKTRSDKDLPPGLKRHVEDIVINPSRPTWGARYRDLNLSRKSSLQIRYKSSL